MANNFLVPSAAYTRIDKGFSGGLMKDQPFFVERALDDFSYLLRIEAENARRHKITANGNAALDGAGACSFDGSGDYLSLNIEAFLTSDFTVEFTANPSANGCLFDCRTPSVDGQGFAIEKNPSGRIGVFDWTGDIISATSGNEITNGIDTHIALVRQGGTLRLYIGGVQKSSVSNSTNFIQTAAVFGIAKDLSSVPYTGKIKRVNIRFDVVYPDGIPFTPPAPSSDITIDSNTKLAIDFAGDNLETRILDLSIPGNGDITEFIPDTSGNKRDASGQNSPTYSAALSTVTLNGTNQYLNGALSYSQTFTVYLVADVSPDTVKQVLFGDDNVLIQLNENEQLEANAGASLINPNDRSGKHIFAAEFNGSTSKIYLDGALIETGDAGNNALAAYGIGAKYSGALPSNMAFYACFVVDGDFSNILNQAILGKYN